MFGRDKGFKCPNLPWTAPDFQAMKGIIHAPCTKPALRLESRDASLPAIANARGWITDIRLGHQLEWPALFAAWSGGEPTPSWDVAGLSRRSATGSRSSEGSILTRRDASPDYISSAIIRAMDAFARGGNQSRINPQSFYRSHLKPGMIPEGTGTNVANFGSFVDIGVHQDGLVHVSQLADHFVKDPSTLVRAGDVVKVRVVEVDFEAQADRSIHAQGRGAAASRNGHFERSFRKEREQEARAPANPTSAKVHA